MKSVFLSCLIRAFINLIFRLIRETLIEVVERALAQDPAVEHTRSLEYAAMK